MPKPKVDPDLAYGLNFDASDLAANRDGAMTSRQQPPLKNELRRRMIANSIFAFTYYMGTMFFVGLGILPAERTIAMALVCLMIAFISGAYALIFTKEMLRFQTQVNTDLKKGKVKSISGKVILDKRSQSTGKSLASAYYLIVNGTELSLDKQAFLRFKHLDYYTLYYAPNSKILLSAEPMEE